MLTYIKDKINGYDLAYYNQETILGGTEIGLSDYPRFNSPYDAGDGMIDAGFNLVSLATNHTMDRGEEAILNSRNYWNSKEDVLAVGSYSSEEEKNQVVIKEKNGITYAMLNYAYGTNGLPVPKGKDYLINVWPVTGKNPETDTAYNTYKEKVKEDVEKLKDKVDVLIVANHWGVEYTHNPTEYQKDGAKFLADLGVDIIIGTHPHVIQPIEKIGNTLVFYSLGNFLSAQKQNDNYNKMVGLMSSVKITKTSLDDDIRVDIQNTNNELIYTYYNQANWRDFKVIPFSNEDIKTYLPDYYNVYERYKGIMQSYDENIIIEDCAN